MAKETRKQTAERELVKAIYISASRLNIIWQGADRDPVKAAKRLLEQRKAELDDLQRALHELGTEQAIEERFGAQWTNS